RLRFHWHVVEREGCQNDVKTVWCELVHNVGTNQMVISGWVERTRLIQHRLRNIWAGDVQSEISKESSRSTGPTAEVERARAMVISVNQCGQIPKREIIGSRKIKRGIRARPFLIFVHVIERMIH